MLSMLSSSLPRRSCRACSSSADSTFAILSSENLPILRVSLRSRPAAWAEPDCPAASGPGPHEPGSSSLPQAGSSARCCDPHRFLHHQPNRSVYCTERKDIGRHAWPSGCASQTISSIQPRCRTPPRQAASWADKGVPAAAACAWRLWEDHRDTASVTRSGPAKTPIFSHRILILSTKRSSLISSTDVKVRKPTEVQATSSGCLGSPVLSLLTAKRFDTRK
mmetsp:Transcript_101292/g.295000  ORF Transcript_101292/g.295000 Transcript_101292/m.295000 type:complete len:221 (+) Transcript_101292:1113-1775(+)